MTIDENKLRGLIACCFILAIIPLIVLSHQSFFGYKIPAFADQVAGMSAVEIIDHHQSRGIYFIASTDTLKWILQDAGIGNVSSHDLQLYDGMQVTIDPSSEKNRLTVANMEAAKRLALGIRFDINHATEDDLLMVKGIGEATAAKILDLRHQLGHFRNMEQLMEIKGIKEKRLAQIKKYLCVAKR